VTFRINGMRYSFAIALLLAAASAFANPSGDYMLLIPINPGTVPGAAATQWTTSVWVTNTSDVDAPVDCEKQPCQVVKAHTTAKIADIPFATPHQGFYLGFSSNFLHPIPAGALYVEERVTDSSTAARSAGTEVPLVRMSALLNATIAMPHVPVNGHSRSRLRIYGAGNGTVTVRVIGVTSNQELLKMTVALTGEDPAKIPQVPFRRWPAYSELALPDSYAGNTDDAVRVEITPADGDPIWAFVSVTDNDSQQFTIISPATPEYVAISLL
jgi:hypothetical protein